MGEVITIGLDIAKSVFQVHGVDDVGAVVIRTTQRKPSSHEIGSHPCARLRAEIGSHLRLAWVPSKSPPSRQYAGWGVCTGPSLHIIRARAAA
jgi:hypothetical protein